MRAIRFCFLGGVGETNKSPTPPAVCFLQGGTGRGVGGHPHASAFPWVAAADPATRRDAGRPEACPTAHIQPANSPCVWLALPAGRK